MVNVKQRAIDDPELLAANEKAKACWKEFETLFSHRSADQRFNVKAALCDSGPVEHISIEVKSLSPDMVTETLDNDPVNLKTLKDGDEVTIKITDIEDWTVYEGPLRIAGGFTIDVLMRRKKADCIFVLSLRHIGIYIRFGTLHQITSFTELDAIVPIG